MKHELSMKLGLATARRRAAVGAFGLTLLTSYGCAQRDSRDSQDSARAELVTRLQSAVGLPVEAVSVAPQRLDLTIVDGAGFADPDVEQRRFDSVATRIWDDGRLGIPAETIAVTIAKPLMPQGMREQHTYFYYRHEFTKGKLGRK